MGKNTHTHIYTHPHTQYGLMLFIEYVNHAFIIYVFMLFSNLSSGTFGRKWLCNGMLCCPGPKVFSQVVLVKTPGLNELCVNVTIQEQRWISKKEEEERWGKEDERENWCPVLEFASEVDSKPKICQNIGKPLPIFLKSLWLDLVNNNQ